ncbi:xanthine dehydrogenase [Pseudomonas sp. PIC25]|uniref:XdhC family protein n=1 Tax=Pseudomonas sp. PIC25 TaxID=1958773 RepID=UPI000BAB4FC1|nr:XdhC/CoxI family protein [Pseudomonas sp. PIC25]PAU63900.1 xanthine dehydrogenase [Pseudomonas sp. PIC25]
MTGTSALLEAIQRAERAGEESVLATVVKVEGSAYRRPGARMLIPLYGGTVGTVSGGCLEAELAKKAWWFTEAGVPRVRRYSTGTDESDDEQERSLTFGLGCNGTVHVLLERLVPASSSPVVELLQQVRRSQLPGALATVISSYRNARVQVGDRLMLEPSWRFAGRLWHAELEEAVRRDLAEVLSRQRSELRVYSDVRGDIEVFLEYVAPQVRLVVFGGGYDAQSLVRMAKMLDWHVTVVDGRTHFARPERFPEADAVICATPGEALLSLDGAVVLVMSHSYSQDLRWLRQTLQASPVYIGQLGPRDRTQRLLAEIDPQGAGLPGLDSLHYPMGLDLGGDTPESVALAALGEITAVLNRREGGMLKHRRAAIHPIEAATVRTLDAPQAEKQSLADQS